MFFGLLTGHNYCHSECQYTAGMKDPFYFSDGGWFFFLILIFFLLFNQSRWLCSDTSVRRPQTDCRMLLGVRSLPVDEALTSVKVPPVIPTTSCETLFYSYVAGGAVDDPPFFFLFFLQSMMRARSSSLMLQFNNMAAVKTLPIVSHLFCTWCVKALNGLR